MLGTVLGVIHYKKCELCNLNSEKEMRVTSKVMIFFLFTRKYLSCFFKYLLVNKKNNALLNANYFTSYLKKLI